MNSNIHKYAFERDHHARVRKMLLIMSLTYHTSCQQLNEYPAVYSTKIKVGPITVRSP